MLGMLGEFGPEQFGHDRSADDCPVRADGDVFRELLSVVGPVRCVDLLARGRVGGGERPVGVDDGRIGDRVDDDGVRDTRCARRARRDPLTASERKGQPTDSIFAWRSS